MSAPGSTKETLSKAQFEWIQKRGQILELLQTGAEGLTKSDQSLSLTCSYTENEIDLALKKRAPNFSGVETCYGFQLSYTLDNRFFLNDIFFSL